MTKTSNTTAFYVLKNQGEYTDQLKMILDNTKITLIFDNTTENTGVMKRIENTLITTCNLSTEEISA